MFRLPTHLETFIPPPSDQLPQGRPWRGRLVLSTPIPPQGAPQQEIYCTAAETEGDNSEVSLWPPQLNVYVLSQRPVLPELQAWLRRETPPMCMFMPDRLADQENHRRNQANFEALTRTLHDGQFVAIAPWVLPDRPSGAGIILFPTATSRALLVGAILLNMAFPEFLASNVPVLPSRPLTIGAVPRHISFNLGHGDSPYDPAPPNIASSQRRHHNAGGQTGDRIGRYPA